MTIRYGLSHEANDQFYATLDRLATQRPGMRLCELGRGANPAVPHDIVQQFEINYTVVDVCAAELEKAPAGYHKVLADITQPNHCVEGPFDLIFSVWCAEHVSDGAAFHRSIYELLAPGGTALHIFPTLYAPPFVVNRLIPEWVSSKLVLWLQPHREPEGDHGKFPARYSWCRGPSPAQLRRIKQLGYEVEEYAGFFGHSGSVAFGAGYLDRLPPLTLLPITSILSW